MNNRDYRSTSKSSRAPAPKKSGLITGLIIGLIVGVGAVVLAVMFLNGRSTPFTNLAKQEQRQNQDASEPDTVTLLEPGSKIEPVQANQATQQAQTVTPSTVTQVEIPPADKPSASTAPATNTPAPSTNEASSGKVNSEDFDFYKILPGQVDPVQAEMQKPQVSTPEKKTSSIYLQAGAFRNEADADNLKAKLALLGVEANIYTMEVADKGVLHRVRIGPFTNPKDVDRIRSELSKNGVATGVVRQ